MDPTAAAHLAQRLSSDATTVCLRVSRRLLAAFPEVIGMLRLEAATSIEARLSAVSVERFYELIRAILLFDMPELAEKELRWAHGVLPRSGVTYEHQAAMVRWFFEEVRHLGLPPSEMEVATELETYILDVLATIYHVKRDAT